MYIQLCAAKENYWKKNHNNESHENAHSHRFDSRSPLISFSGADPVRLDSSSGAKLEK